MFRATRQYIEEKFYKNTFFNQLFLEKKIILNFSTIPVKVEHAIPQGVE